MDRSGAKRRRTRLGTLLPAFAGNPSGGTTMSLHLIIVEPDRKMSPTITSDPYRSSADPPHLSELECPPLFAVLAPRNIWGSFNLHKSRCRGPRLVSDPPSEPKPHSLLGCGCSFRSRNAAMSRLLGDGTLRSTWAPDMMTHGPEQVAQQLVTMMRLECRCGFDFDPGRNPTGDPRRMLTQENDKTSLPIHLAPDASVFGRRVLAWYA
ncbi:hypothetical protein B0T14DRAFT_327600 [Immersiella caudata]|uniref:Uncharacterized protein n=1 Tax=Immersiella caudata TaxID=314043 RepID=A0AA39U300_9PEZI|nr:hypothetical protein B0T14DRAFT_327600 [Immersiella caudata]